MEPLPQVLRRLLHDPLTHVEDHAGALEHGQERSGGDESVVGIVPTDQRLDALDTAGTNVDLGLIVELELAPLEGHPQLVLEGELADHLGVLFRTVVQLPFSGSARVA